MMAVLAYIENWPASKGLIPSMQPDQYTGFDQVRRIEQEVPHDDLKRPQSAPSSSFTRILEIFDLFSPDKMTVNVDEIVSLYGIGLSTGYRYMRELCEKGFLTQLGKGSYSLGPRIVELERIVELNDPVLGAGRRVMEGLDRQTTNATFMLCTFYKDRVLCIHQVGDDRIKYGSEVLRLVRGRGTPLPLFQGAGSLAILANLAPTQIKSLYMTNQALISEHGLARDWVGFRKQMLQIRKAGFAMTSGQINEKLVGLAVPFFAGDGPAVGSLLMVTASTDDGRESAKSTLPTLLLKAAEIGAELAPTPAADIVAARAMA